MPRNSVTYIDYVMEIGMRRQKSTDSNMTGDAPSTSDTVKASLSTSSSDTDSSDKVTCTMAQPTHPSVISISSEARKIKNKANRLIVRAPVEQLRRIAESPGVSSIRSETQYFVGITSMHGVLRVWKSAGKSRFLWLVALLFCAIMMLVQIYNIFVIAYSQTVVSDISFRLPDEGIQYPTLTICTFSYVTKHYTEKFRKTYNVSDDLLVYILMTTLEIQVIPVADLPNLEKGHAEYVEFLKRHKNFSMFDFFVDAAPTCKDTLRVCSYATQEFDCCEDVRTIMSDLGNCFQIDMHYHTLSRNITPRSGVNNGLQIYVDFRTEDLLPPPFYDFMTNIDDGFRYYLHQKDSLPYISVEGTGVSTGKKAFSSVHPNHYTQLAEESRCTMDWPENLRDGFTLTHPYTGSMCYAHCLGKHFNDHCGCTPFMYSLNGTYRMCTLYENHQCLQNAFGINLETNRSDPDIMRKIMPECAECSMSCDRWDYQSYTSYTDGFSRSVSTYIKKHENIDDQKLKDYSGISVFFREVGYTEYEQSKRNSLSEILADIGGNMGLFLGMSVLTVIETCIYIVKVSWAFMSTRRRMYMHAKDLKQRERERRIEKTLEDLANRKDQPKPDAIPLSVASKLLKIAGSIKRKTAAVWHPPERAHSPARAAPMSPAYYLDNIVRERTVGNGLAGGSAAGSPVVELELELGAEEEEEAAARAANDPTPPGSTHVRRSRWPKLSTIRAARILYDDGDGTHNPAFVDDNDQKPKRPTTLSTGARSDR